EVAVAEKPTRGEEKVYQGKLGLDEALAQEEGLRRNIGEAFVTALRRFTGTAFLVVHGSQQLPLAVADGQVLVEGVDDRHPRQRFFYLPDHVIAEEERVLEMNNRRLEGKQELVEVFRVKVLARHRPIEVAEFVAVGVQEILVGIAVD